MVVVISMVTDHRSRTTTNIIIMKKFEILGELPKYDTETRSEQMLVEKMASTDLLYTELPTDFQFVKKKKKGSAYEV